MSTTRRVPSEVKSDSILSQIDDGYVRVPRASLSGLIPCAALPSSKDVTDAKSLPVRDGEFNSPVMASPLRLTATYPSETWMSKETISREVVRSLKSFKHPRTGRILRGTSRDLVVRFNATTATSAFINTVEMLQPNSSSSTESTLLASLYDLMRCRSITFYARIVGNATGSLGAWGMVFDPANPGAYTSVAGTLVADQKIGPIGYNPVTPNVGSLVESSTGYYKLVVTVPRNLPTAGGGAVNEAVGDGWFGTADTSASCGFLKFAGDSVSGSGFMLEAYAIFHCDWCSSS